MMIYVVVEYMAGWRAHDVGGSNDDSVFYGGKVSLDFVHIMCTFLCFR